MQKQTNEMNEMNETNETNEMNEMNETNETNEMNEMWMKWMKCEWNVNEMNEMNETNETNEMNEMNEMNETNETNEMNEMWMKCEWNVNEMWMKCEWNVNEMWMKCEWNVWAQCVPRLVKLARRKGGQIWITRAKNINSTYSTQCLTTRPPLEHCRADLSWSKVKKQIQVTEATFLWAPFPASAAGFRTFTWASTEKKSFFYKRPWQAETKTSCYTCIIECSGHSIIIHHWVFQLSFFELLIVMFCQNPTMYLSCNCWIVE